MGQSFKALIQVAETLSDDFTQVVAVIDGTCWELDSTLSSLRKDAAGYRVTNAANLTGGANYVPGELEKVTGRAGELLKALQPVAELAARWNAEDFAKASTLDARAVPGKAARFEIDAR
jgi:hypothetical protein